MSNHRGNKIMKRQSWWLKPAGHLNKSKSWAGKNTRSEFLKLKQISRVKHSLLGSMGLVYLPTCIIKKSTIHGSENKSVPWIPRDWNILDLKKTPVLNPSVARLAVCKGRSVESERPRKILEQNLDEGGRRRNVTWCYWNYVFSSMYLKVVVPMIGFCLERRD